MTTTSKLALLEQVDRVFRWGWIVLGILALFFLVRALAFDGAWSPFIWTLVGSVMCKWLLRGFLDNQKRIAYEARLVEQGLTPEEAALKWVEEYDKGRL